jgi:hypothetical protein
LGTQRPIADAVVINASLPGLTEMLKQARRIRTTLRSAELSAPEVRAGRPPEDSRYLLIDRLAIVYTLARREHLGLSDGSEFPRREQDRTTGRDRGPFLDFVKAALQALPAPHSGYAAQGIADATRSVLECWGKSRKKRRNCSRGELS